MRLTVGNGRAGDSPIWVVRRMRARALLAPTQEKSIGPLRLVRPQFIEASLLAFDEHEDRSRREGSLGGNIRMDLEMVLMNAGRA